VYYIVLEILSPTRNSTPKNPNLLNSLFPYFHDNPGLVSMVQDYICSYCHQLALLRRLKAL